MGRHLSKQYAQWCKMEYLAQLNLKTWQYYTKRWKGRSKVLSLHEYAQEFSDLGVTEREYEITQELHHLYF